MTRYFYTDPLAAAWMAKQFGMEFRHPCGGRYALSALLHEAMGDRRQLPDKHVHPDSLHLLEPRKGDKILYSFGAGQHAGEAWDEVIGIVTHDDEGYPYTGNGEPYVLVDGCDEFPVSRLKAIFQRNGKPFFWPESEAA